MLLLIMGSSWNQCRGGHTNSKAKSNTTWDLSVCFLKKKYLWTCVLFQELLNHVGTRFQLSQTICWRQHYWQSFSFCYCLVKIIFLLILKNSFKKILLLQVLPLGKLVLTYRKENYFRAIWNNGYENIFPLILGGKTV